MTTFDLYGTAQPDIDEVARQVAAALRIGLQPRHSYYLGGYYKGEPEGDVSLRVQPNLNAPDEEEEDDRYQVPAFKHLPVLLYLTVERDAERYEGLLAGLAGLRLLRRAVR
ncbi:MAG TPA: hypothetical protein VKP11_11640 [Frankiaceae bacterium]|nr:hypothetical protein [Frankiaceae bacterium]